MRWKWIVGVSIFLIIALMVTVYVFVATYDYNKLKPRIARMVKDVTGRELRLGGEINLAIGFSPSLVVTDVALANVSWGSQPQMIEIEKLQANVRLLPLLFKDVQVNQIDLSGVKVLLETGPEARENWDFLAGSGSVESTGAFKPTTIDADQVSIENLHLTFLRHETGSKTQFVLASLAMSRQGTEDVLMLKLRADYNGQPLTLSGKTGRVRHIFTHQHFPLQLSGSLANAEFKIQGAIDDVLNLKGINLDARLTGKNLATLGSVLDITLPESKSFDVTGHLKGSMDSLRLENIKVNLSGGGVDMAVSGNVGNLIAFRSLDLKLKISGKDFAVIAPLIGEKLPATDEFKVQGRLKGSAKVLSFSEAQGSARRGSMSFTVNGTIKDLLTLRGMGLNAGLKGKNLQEFGEIIGEKLPTTDVFAVEGRLTGSTKAISLKEAKGSAKQGNLNVALSGEVKDLRRLGGMDLKLDSSGRDLSEVGPIIGKKLPKTGAFTLKGRLKGSAKAPSLQEIWGNIRRGELRLDLQGGVKSLLTLSGMDLKLKGSGNDLAKVGPIIGKKLPATGEFSFQGRLRGSTKAIALQNAQGRFNRGGLRLSLNGGIKNIIALTGIDIRFKGSGIDLAEVGPVIDRTLPATNKFTTQGRLTGSSKGLSLTEVKGNVSRGRLNLTFNGGISELFALEGINFKLKAMGKELAEIGPLVGANLPKLGPFDVSGRLLGSAKTISLVGFSAIVDKSDFKGRAKVEFRKRPKITVRLESSMIDFTPLLRIAEKDKKELGKEDKRERRLFPEDPLPFDALKMVDADIVVKARNIHVRDAQLEFGHFFLILGDSNLSIDKLEATYKETKISGNLQINAGTPSQVSTHFLVQNFNLGDFLKETGKSDQIRAIVDIAAHGKSNGDSVQSLMADLNGSIGAVMGEGYLTKYLDMLSAGLSQKVVQIWKPHKAVDQIKCAVVQFDIKAGVAASQAFVFDTQAGVLAGEGKINLGTEKINFLLVPKPAHPDLNILTNLRVSGTVKEPHVGVDKASALIQGARALSTLVAGPLGLLAPFVHLGANKSHPCEVASIGQLGLNIPAKN
jgi:uncharacterized protein involved in outer membrane biogenesis